MLKEPLSLKEMSDLTERLAYARCVSKGIKYPNAHNVQDEISVILNPFNKVPGHRPEMSKEDAAVWLARNGYEVPKEGKNADGWDGAPPSTTIA